jgi:uncharacterized protein YdaU (DUF1376 family)
VAKAPSYPMYPKDFNTDENVLGMTLAEVGLYILCLNHSWTNDGLPAEIDELSRVLRVKKTEIRKHFPRVSECFPIAEDGRRRNRKQEELRREKTDFVESRRDAARSRWDAKPDARALHVQCSAPSSSSPSPSASANSASRGAVSETEEVLDSGFPGTGADTGFVARLYAAAEAAKPDVTDGELAEALRATYRENQQSPGLWLSTVPAYLRSATARDWTEARPMMLVRARPKTARDAQIDDWKAQMREKYGEAV